MNSIWTEITKKPNFNSLDGNIKTNVLIVGGGLTGILCAYMLHDAGIDYTLIEANEICSGITKNTTAKITMQHGLIYHKIIKKYGIKAAKLYYKANSEAISHYENLCKMFDCRFETQDAVVYSTTDKTKISEEHKAYRELGIPSEFVTQIPLPLSIIGAVKIYNQGQINLLEFLYNLSQKLNIKEHTRLVEITPDCVKTDRGNICYKKAIIATHFPIINKHGSYFMKMYQHRSYVLALENAKNVSGMYIDENEKGLSFRNFDKYLLLGGGSHRTGKKGGCWHELECFAQKHYPKSRIAYRWATQDCITLDSMPYIGKYSRNTPNLFVATGYNKWGFTSSMVAAEMLCDLVQEKKNEYTELFSPSRSVIHPKLAGNAAEAVFNLLTPTVPRCPHMGCALKYNKYEHTWDCPCHGSRFTSDGKLADNPATQNLKR